MISGVMDIIWREAWTTRRTQSARQHSAYEPGRNARRNPLLGVCEDRESIRDTQTKPFAPSRDTSVVAARCAEYAQKLGGESPLPNLMEVKG